MGGVDRDLPVFEKYSKNAVSGKKLVAELKKLREAASRQWSEGNRKEVELVIEGILLVECAHFGIQTRHSERRRSTSIGFDT